jgi:hypothetical protein
VLAIVTAVVDAAGAGRAASPASASATLAAYRPALFLITGVAGVGALVALSGLRRRAAAGATGAAGQVVIDVEPARPAVAEAPEFVEDRR